MHMISDHVTWHFKYFLKVKFFSQNSHCYSCVFKFKIKSDFKVHIETKHVQMFFMLCFNVNLNIRFSFEFGNTHRAICNAGKLKVILAMSLSLSLFYWDFIHCHCHSRVFKFKIKSDLKVHIKTICAHLF